MTWARLNIDGMSVPEVLAEVAAARTRTYEDCQSVAVRCGSLDPDKHGWWLSCFVTTIAVTKNMTQIPDYDLDGIIRPMVRGMAVVMEREGRVDAS